eukprot:7526504-Pyramimonas_sp.AAC.2
MEMSPSLDAKMLADAKLKCVTRGICPLASRDWSPFEEYARSPRVTGPHLRNMPARLARLVPV